MTSAALSTTSGSFSLTLHGIKMMNMFSYFIGNKIASRCWRIVVGGLLIATVLTCAASRGTAAEKKPAKKAPHAAKHSSAKSSGAKHHATKSSAGKHGSAKRTSAKHHPAKRHGAKSHSARVHAAKAHRLAHQPRRHLHSAHRTRGIFGAGVYVVSYVTPEDARGHTHFVHASSAEGARAKVLKHHPSAQIVSVIGA